MLPDGETKFNYQFIQSGMTVLRVLGLMGNGVARNNWIYLFEQEEKLRELLQIIQVLFADLRRNDTSKRTSLWTSVTTNDQKNSRVSDFFVLKHTQLLEPAHGILTWVPPDPKFLSTWILSSFCILSRACWWCYFEEVLLFPISIYK